MRLEATFRAVTDKSTPEFHDRDLYPFIYDLRGVNVAHGARPALIGKNANAVYQSLSRGHIALREAWVHD